jgi:hypothetical protein
MGFSASNVIYAGSEDERVENRNIQNVMMIIVFFFKASPF